MPTLSIIIGFILTLLGLYGYFGLGAQSITALIPSFFGLPLIVLGIIGKNEKYRKTTMHFATGLMLLGFLGTLMGLIKFFEMIAGTKVDRPDAIIIQTIMSLLSLTFLIFAIKSFIIARTNK